VAEQFQVPSSDILYERKRFWVRAAPERGVMLAEIALRSVRGEEAVMGYGSVSETFDSVAIAPNAALHVVDVDVDGDTG
jgi:hypothetical protein